jgi:hypothetical protein
MQPRHSDRPKMPGAPRPKVEHPHRPVRHVVARQAADPMVPPGASAPAPRTRLEWSRSVLDQARSGQTPGAGYPEPAARDFMERPRPVRSQAAARARAGEAFVAPVEAPAPIAAPVRIVLEAQPAAMAEPTVEPVPYMDFTPEPVPEESSLASVLRRWKQTLSSLFS